ncbi:hypothetical protein D9M68_882550 [compost metagenome]
MHVGFTMLVAVVMPLFGVVMRVKSTALAHRQHVNRRVIGQFHHLGLDRQGVERLGEEQLEPVAGPEHDIGRFERPGIGGLERIGVRRG